MNDFPYWNIRGSELAKDLVHWVQLLSSPYYELLSVAW
jgi:hypothetical protein